MIVQEALDAAAGSVEELAEEVGVKPHTLWSWRSGRRKPRPENVEALADVLERRGGRLSALAGELRASAQESGD